MRDAFRLSVIVGKAAFIVTTGCFALILTPMLWEFDPDLRPTKGEILGALACSFPIGIATAWMVRKLRTVYSRHGARAVSIAFGIFSPIFLLVSILVPIPGGYAFALAGSKIVGLIGYFVGTTVMTAFLSFLVCALVLRVTRLAISFEQND